MIGEHPAVFGRLHGVGPRRRRLDLVVGDPGRIKPVGLIPGERVGLQPGDNGWQALAKAVFRGPAQMGPRRSQIEFVVVPGDVDHPGPDETVLVEDGGFRPGSGPGGGLGNGEGFPCLVMDQPTQIALDFVIGHHIGLAEQDRKDLGKIGASIDHPLDGGHQIIEVQGGLAGGQTARIDPRAGPLLVDAGDLLGQEGGVTAVVIDAGRPQEDGGNLAAFFADQGLGENL